MEHRLLAGSGLRIPALTLGCANFGGKGTFFENWGVIDNDQATRIVDICLDHGLTMFDTADCYSAGRSEETLGHAIKGKRDKVLISTKAARRFRDDPNSVGASRAHLHKSIHESLTRLGTDYIDLFQLHGFDALTPVEETLSTLDAFIRQGKIRYLGGSNYSGWHLFKTQSAAERYGYPRFVAHQAYYSLIGREFEWDLMPVGLDQKIGTVVWSPLGSGRLTGKIRRGQPMPAPGASRLSTPNPSETCPQGDLQILYNIVDTLDQLALETNKTTAQVALNWLLQRPTVATLVIGARNETQIKENVGAVGWNLSPGQVARLDAASAIPRIYPYWHQAATPERNPFPTP